MVIWVRYGSDVLVIKQLGWLNNISLRNKFKKRKKGEKERRNFSKRGSIVCFVVLR